MYYNYPQTSSSNSERILPAKRILDWEWALVYTQVAGHEPVHDQEAEIEWCVFKTFQYDVSGTKKKPLFYEVLC